MRVRFLNHSCVLVETETTRILCDPWFHGTAFDDGWRLLYEESHDINDIACDWIWISHEHPDHFSIPTLRGLTTERQFLYQETEDRKVKEYLEKRGHVVRELGDRTTTRIGDIDCTLFVCDGYDSAMLFEADGQRFLNTNDARVALVGLLEAIKARSVELDVLAIQFSYANWAGNPEDVVTPRVQQEIVNKRVWDTVEALQPRRTILFASFIYFSHEDNFCQNRGCAVRPAYAMLESSSTVPVVMQPGEVLDLRDPATDPRASEEAIRFWEDCYASIEVKDRDTRSYSRSQLEEEYHLFLTGHWQEHDRAYAEREFEKPIELRVSVKDHGEIYRLSLLDGTFESADGPEWDVEISSATLVFLFRNRWARGTVTISAKIRFNYETAWRYFVFFLASYAANIGRYLGKNLKKEDYASVVHTDVLMTIIARDPRAQQGLASFLERGESSRISSAES